jgi:hypothetical protein
VSAARTIAECCTAPGGGPSRILSCAAAAARHSGRGARARVSIESRIHTRAHALCARDDSLGLDQAFTFCR